MCTRVGIYYLIYVETLVIYSRHVLFDPVHPIRDLFVAPSIVVHISMLGGAGEDGSRYLDPAVCEAARVWGKDGSIALRAVSHL